MPSVERVGFIDDDGTSKFVPRYGHCDFEKCGARCCMVSVLNAMRYDGTALSKMGIERQKEFLQRYFKNRLWVYYDNAQKTYIFVLKEPCAELDLETLKCRVYDERPENCRVHPLPWDWMYRLNRKHCTHSFDDPWETFPDTGNRGP